MKLFSLHYCKAQKLQQAQTEKSNYDERIKLKRIIYKLEAIIKLPNSAIRALINAKVDELKELKRE